DDVVHQCMGGMYVKLDPPIHGEDVIDNVVRGPKIHIFAYSMGAFTNSIGLD
ncbi:12897_t:CDS:1, partial [Rhizophagus irregularis]